MALVRATGEAGLQVMSSMRSVQGWPIAPSGCTDRMCRTLTIDVSARGAPQAAVPPPLERRSRPGHGAPGTPVSLDSCLHLNPCQHHRRPVRLPPRPGLLTLLRQSDRLLISGPRPSSTPFPCCPAVHGAIQPLPTPAARTLNPTAGPPCVARSSWPSWPPWPSPAPCVSAKLQRRSGVHGWTGPRAACLRWALSPDPLPGAWHPLIRSQTGGAACNARSTRCARRCCTGGNPCARRRRRRLPRQPGCHSLPHMLLSPTS